MLSTELSCLSSETQTTLPSAFAHLLFPQPNLEFCFQSSRSNLICIHHPPMVQPWCFLPLTCFLCPMHFLCHSVLFLHWLMLISFFIPSTGFIAPTTRNPRSLLPTHISPTTHPPPSLPILFSGLPTSSYLLLPLVKVSISTDA